MCGVHLPSCVRRLENDRIMTTADRRWGAGPDDEADAAPVFEALARELRPSALSAEQRERMRERVLRAAIATQGPAVPIPAASAAAPPGTTTHIAGEEGWIATSRYARVKILAVDAESGTQELLVRLLPGVLVSAHSHRTQETMVILEGECHVGEHLLSLGDVHVAPAGSHHPPITTRTGALIFLRGEYPSPANVS
jgi:anti-sigma factor ChrR (cupin superfamily)